MRWVGKVSHYANSSTLSEFSLLEISPFLGLRVSYQDEGRKATYYYKKKI